MYSSYTFVYKQIFNVDSTKYELYEYFSFNIYRHCGSEIPMIVQLYFIDPLLKMY